MRLRRRSNLDASNEASGNPAQEKTGDLRLMDNLVFWALNRHILVVSDDVKVHGRLIAIQEVSRGRDPGRDCKPVALILETAQGRSVIRGWELIALEAQDNG